MSATSWPLRSRALLPMSLGGGPMVERMWQRKIWLSPSPVFCARRLYEARCRRVSRIIPEFSFWEAES